MSGLSPKHQAFAAEYIANGGNGVQAALAIWPASSYDTARMRAQELLAREDVSDEVVRLKGISSTTKLLDANERRLWLADLTRADPRNVLASKPHLAQEVTVTRRIMEDGSVEEKIRVKLPSKIQGLALDARLAGDLKDGGSSPQTPIDGALDRLLGLADDEEQGPDTERQTSLDDLL